MDNSIVITYTNWRGYTSRRRIIPAAWRFGTSAWHPEPQWLILAHDVDKDAEREFAFKDCVFPVPADVPTLSANEMIFSLSKATADALYKKGYEAGAASRKASPGAVMRDLGWAALGAIFLMGAAFALHRYVLPLFG